MGLSVGAVVPNYNYACYLPERLASITRQTRPVQRLVFLDDASTDDSMAVAGPLLAACGCAVDVRRNDRNSGSVLRQWQLGASLLDTDLVWIAEADDSADPALVAALAACLEADAEARFAFCDSAAIDGDGQRIAADGKAYASAIGDHGLDADGVFACREFLERFLSPRNLVVNASAVLWRRSALLAALGAVRRQMASWRCTGDWHIYAEACGAPGRIHYLSTPLNLHRRHAGSVTGGADPAAHFAEVVEMMVLLRQRIGGTPARDGAMRGHLDTLRDRWGLDARVEPGLAP